MVHNVMTDAFDVDDEAIKSKPISEQIAVRQKALDDIDRAKFGWYHVRYLSSLSIEPGTDMIRAIMVAGSGFFTDAYDIFSMNLGISLPLCWHQ